MDNYLKKRLKDKSIYIWGARVVGQGFQRKALENKLAIRRFIDSDKCIQGRVVNGTGVISPENIVEEFEKDKNDKKTVVIAVSIKEKEIIEQLKKMGISEELEIIKYSDYTKDFYTVDIVSACNLRCASCAHSIPNHGVPMNIMKLEDVERVLEKIVKESPNTSHVSLYSWGEPLLHPDIDKIIRMFHEKNIAVGLSTNLSHEMNSKIDIVAKCEPDYLKISLSGYYPEAYNNTHQGGDITLVKSNLYRLKYMLDKHNANTLVDINYHLYKDNNGKNLRKMTELAEELGFTLSTVHALIMPLERVIDYLEEKPSEQTTNLSKNLLVTIDEGIKASSEVQLGGECPFRENQININADLTVPVCCTVFNRENIVSKNYLEEELETINKGKAESEICTKCMELRLPEYNMGFNKEGWQSYAKEKISLDN